MKFSLSLSLSLSLSHTHRTRERQKAFVVENLRAEAREVTEQTDEKDREKGEVHEPEEMHHPHTPEHTHTHTYTHKALRRHGSTAMHEKVPHDNDLKCTKCGRGGVESSSWFEVAVKLGRGGVSRSGGGGRGAASAFDY